MNMKKAIAGVFAGAVAISAVATTMVSAKTVSYAAIDKTIEMSSVSNYYAKNYSKTYEQNWTSTQINGNASAVGDKIDITFSGLIKGVKDVKLTITDTSTGIKVLDEKKLIDGEKTVSSSGADITASYTLIADDVAKINPAHNFSVKLAYEVLPSTSKSYSTKSNAKDKNPDDEYTLKIDGTVATTGGNAGSLFDLVDATYTDKATFEVTNDKVVKINANGNADLNDDIVKEVAAALESRTKAQVILNFNDPDFDDDDVQVTLKVDGEFYTKSKVDYKASSDTATFDWGSMVKSASSINAIGDVTNKIDTINVKIDADDVADDKQFELKSITIKGPSESAEVLSAGESVADTTAAITTAATAATTTAAPATEAPATTTAAASNPKTGNAPVALAVIPVAIAAAAIIAKKRG